jgi:hypothetical protein
MMFNLINTSIMHRFRFNQALMLAGNDEVALSPQKGAADKSCRQINHGSTTAQAVVMVMFDRKWAIWIAGNKKTQEPIVTTCCTDDNVGVGNPWVNIVSNRFSGNFSTHA